MIDYERVLNETSENIQAAITNNGYCTVGEFCKDKGLHKSTVVKIVMRKRAPTLKSLIEIANAADVSLAQLLGPEAF